jgi:hypothetical protein
VCFTAVACLKAAILKAHGISFAPFVFAAVKALICAKFVSMGQIFHLGERFKSLPLIWPTIYKSLCFLSMLIVLNALEEVFVGFLHGRTIVDSMADFGGGTMDQLIAKLPWFFDANALFCLSDPWRGRRRAQSCSSVFSPSSCCPKISFRHQ